MKEDAMNRKQPQISRRALLRGALSFAAAAAVPDIALANLPKATPRDAIPGQPDFSESVEVRERWIEKLIVKDHELQKKYNSDKAKDVRKAFDNSFANRPFIDRRMMRGTKYDMQDMLDR